MGLDPSIIGSFRGVELQNPLDMQAKAMGLKQATQQAQLTDQQFADSQAQRDAFKSNVNPDGTINREGVVNALAKSGQGAKAAEFAHLWQNQDAEKFKQQHDIVSKLWGSVVDQNSYQAALQQGAKLGLPNLDKMPAQYDPVFMDKVQKATMTVGEQADLHFKQLNSDRDAAKLKIERDKLDIERGKAAAGKAPTSDQFKAAGFGQRVASAEKTMEELAKGGFDGNDRRSWIQRNLPGEVKPVELQKLEQAQRNFINATLRRESGAAISESEFESARKQYFPQPGDSAEVIEQKRQNRLDIQASLSSEAGSAYNLVGERRAQIGQQNPPANAAPGQQRMTPINGAAPQQKYSWEK